MLLSILYLIVISGLVKIIFQQLEQLDVQNELDVQGEYFLQFGKYRGQSFRWMLGNALGYVGWFVDNIRDEKVTKSPISQNKTTFKLYAESFQEVCDVVALKKKQREEKEAKMQLNSTQ